MTRRPTQVRRLWVRRPGESAMPPALTRLLDAPPAPGWLRLICRAQHCLNTAEMPITPGMSLPDLCPACGAPWRAIAETVGTAHLPTSAG